MQSLCEMAGGENVHLTCESDLLKLSKGSAFIFNVFIMTDLMALAYPSLSRCTLDIQQSSGARSVLPNTNFHTLLLFFGGGLNTYDPSFLEKK